MLSIKVTSLINQSGCLEHDFYLPFHRKGMSSGSHWLSLHHFSRWEKNAPPTSSGLLRKPSMDVIDHFPEASHREIRSRKWWSDGREIPQFLLVTISPKKHSSQLVFFAMENGWFLAHWWNMVIFHSVYHRISPSRCSQVPCASWMERTGWRVTPCAP